MNLTTLAHEIAARVPALAQDSPLNNAMLLQRLLEEEYWSLIAERDSWEACVRAMNDGTSPCGHNERYAYTNDGGKTIICTLCAVELLRKERQRMEDMLMGGKIKMLFRLAKRLAETDAAFFAEKRKAETAAANFEEYKKKYEALEKTFKQLPGANADAKAHIQLLQQKVRRLEAIATKCPNCAPQL